MQMHDEVSHFGIVDGTLRLCFPGRIGARIVRKDADDVEFAEVTELHAGYAVQLAAKNQMEQLLCWLLLGVRHEKLSSRVVNSINGLSHIRFGPLPKETELGNIWETCVQPENRLRRICDLCYTLPTYSLE
jgi:hypothetical protein